jgi:uncharacterized protein YdhG (YjbR/CyaY superfamily)
MTTERSPIDAYLERFEGPQRETLEMLRDTLRELLPAAEECQKYRMPCFAVRGKAVAGFDGFRKHNSYFPHSGTVLEQVRGIPAWCTATAGTLQFPLDRPLPVTLVRKLVRTRLEQISDVADGKRLELSPQGVVIAEGPMKAGRKHGTWRWYGPDGSVRRTARFRDGEQVGAPSE